MRSIKKDKIQNLRIIQEQIAKNGEDIKIGKHIQIRQNYLQNYKKNDKILEIQINKFDLKKKDDKTSNEEQLKESSDTTPKNKEEKSPSIMNKFQRNHISDNIKKPFIFKSRAIDFKIKYKTELCKYYEIEGYCKYGDKCAYAHGKENLRSKVTNTTSYRTKKCVQFFDFGFCPYGNRCQFAHQLATNIINNPYDRKMLYKTTLDIISKAENIDNIKKLIEKPRLPVFQSIVNTDNKIKSRLLDDIKKICSKGTYLRTENN